MKATLKVFVSVVMFVFAGYGLAEAVPSGVSTVGDAEGDFTTNAVNTGPYMDVVSAKVQQRHDGSLSFLMELAGAIPDVPTETDLIWPFHIDTDPNASPGGLYVDYIVRVRWLGGAFVGQVVHRFTTNTGEVGLTIAGVPFEINGATVKLTVDPALLGSPNSFDWNAATRPGATVPYSDFAPNCLECLTTWSSK